MNDVQRAMWVDLPLEARDWLDGTQHAVWLPPALTPTDMVKARLVLRDWDALAGRLVRESLFGDGEPRELRKLAEAVAATAEQLSVLLDGARP